jgi:hypothetical protein
VGCEVPEACFGILRSALTQVGLQSFDYETANEKLPAIPGLSLFPSPEANTHLWSVLGR